MYDDNWDIKIDSNENNYGCSPKVIDAIRNINIGDISFYPYYGILSDKIAKYNGFDIDNIKVTNGADEAISSIIQTYIEKDDILLTLDVSFDMPNIYTQIQGGKILKVPFKEKWVFPIDEFIDKLNNEKVKVVYLAVPNNPTGNIISEEDILKILGNAQDKAVIIDETYANYCEISYKNLVKKYDNLFIVKSFSKDFALAGLRLGYIISSKYNIEVLKRVVSPFSVNKLAMIAGIMSLDDTEYFSKIKKDIIESREELMSFFNSMGAFVYDSWANFLLIDFKQKAEFVYKKLIEKKITVKLYKKGSLLEGHLRVTIPTKIGVEKIKEALKIKPSLVFDMDGVLVDARNSYRVTIQKTFEKYAGKSVTSDEIQRVKNNGGMNNDWDLTKYLLEREGISLSYDEITQTFQSIYWNDGKGLINDENSLLVRSIFEELSKNYNLSIFTGRLKNEAFYALNRFGITDLFYPIITTDDIPFSKQKPDSYGLNMVKELSIASEYFYFGDTIDDMKCAKGAGYYPIGVLPPQDKSEELKNKLKQYGANDVIDSVNDVKNILEKIYAKI